MTKLPTQRAEFVKPTNSTKMVFQRCLTDPGLKVSLFMYVELTGEVAHDMVQQTLSSTTHDTLPKSPLQTLLLSTRYSCRGGFLYLVHLGDEFL